MVGWYCIYVGRVRGNDATVAHWKSFVDFIFIQRDISSLENTDYFADIISCLLLYQWNINL